MLHIRGLIGNSSLRSAMSGGRWLVLLAMSALPLAARGQDLADEPMSFAQRLRKAEDILLNMRTDPQELKSANFHVLYVCKKEMAEERKRTLEATRRNFLGFMRRMKLDINPKHEKLLVILLDDQQQMIEFYRRAAEDEVLPGWVAGFYDPKRNWSVFYNQRNGDDIINTERMLNDWAQQLIDIPGGPTALVTFKTERGPITVTKREAARQMEEEWRRIIGAINEYNVAVTQHEGAHQLAFNVGVQKRGRPYPKWLSEGLACVFEVPAQKGKSAMGAARTNGYRLDQLRELQQGNQDVGLAELIRLDYHANIASVQALYAESWATFSFLFTRYPKELSAYAAYLAERADLPEDETYDELAEFQKFFSAPVADLQSEFDDYIARLK